MRDRRILVELVFRDDDIEVNVTDYKLGAVRIHGSGHPTMAQAFSAARKAITKKFKDERSERKPA